MTETCPAHPTQPRIHCACSAGAAIFPCSICRQDHMGPTCMTTDHIAALRREIRNEETR